jgi:2-amino-4-hydroxy-6-hydroxymethyldihydropteridine diphosphokinase
MRQIAYVGLGSNLGADGRTPAEAVLAAMEALGSLVARSCLYQTRPVGYAAQPAFVNAVVALETQLPPQDLLRDLLTLERRFGRDRSAGVRNGPRTLDLDLLLLGDMVLQTDDLTLPHPRLAERRFVLAPLAEIAPDVVHPVLRKTMWQLLENLPDEGENSVETVNRLSGYK